MRADEFFKHGIFWITRCIAQGGYPIDDDSQVLREGGITHLLNLDLPYSDLAGILACGLEGAIWKPITDGRPIPKLVALECLDTLHSVLRAPKSKVYVHCNAGVNRSPTIVLLYLMACGMTPRDACDRIMLASPHAVPGHPSLCNAELIALVQEHGRAHYLPLPRPEILEPYLS
jgi:hypothetical protein